VAKYQEPQSEMSALALRIAPFLVQSSGRYRDEFGVISDFEFGQQVQQGSTMALPVDEPTLKAEKPHRSLGRDPPLLGAASKPCPC